MQLREHTVVKRRQDPWFLRVKVNAFDPLAPSKELSLQLEYRISLSILSQGPSVGYLEGHLSPPPPRVIDFGQSIATT